MQQKHVLGTDSIMYRYEFVYAALIEKDTLVTVSDGTNGVDHYLDIVAGPTDRVAVWFPSNKFVAAIRRTHPHWQPQWVVADGTRYETLPANASHYEVAAAAMEFLYSLAGVAA